MMIRILKTELAYYRNHLLFILLVAFFFSSLFLIFEPPDWQKVFAILFIGPMTFGTVIAINRSKELRDHFWLSLPLKHHQVYLARTLFLFVVLFSSVVVALIAFAIKGQASEAIARLGIPTFTRGFLVLSVFQMQMDLALKNLQKHLKMLAGVIIAISYVLIVWVLVYFNWMSEMLIDFGAGFVVDYSLSPLHSFLSEPMILAVALAVYLFNYIIFIQERHPQVATACRRV